MSAHRLMKSASSPGMGIADRDNPIVYIHSYHNHNRTSRWGLKKGRRRAQRRWNRIIIEEYRDNDYI